MTATAGRVGTGAETVPDPRTGHRPTSALALVLVTAVSPLATDMYLPALPAMQQSLHTSAALIQATLTTFVVGFAVGQVVTGPNSDGRGRRFFTLWGAALFALGSLACAVAPSIWIVLAARALEGVGGGAAVAAGRAMVTDRFDSADAAKRLATLFSFLLLGPVVAPVLGGAILTMTDWRGIFLLLAVVGAAMTVAAAVGLPETLQDAARTRTRLAIQLGRYTDLLSEPTIRRLLLANSSGSAAMFVYLGSASLVYQTQLAASPRQFSLLFGASAALMTGASIGFRRLLSTHRLPALHLTGAIITTTAAVVLIVLTLTASPPLWLAALIITAALAGNGFCAPANTIRIQTAGSRAAGTASALSGATAYLSGALTAPLVGLLGRPTLLAMAALMAAFFSLQLLLLLRANMGLTTPSPPPASPSAVANGQ